MTETTGRVETTVTTTYALDYLVHVPAGYDPQGEPVPLVLFLHGAGERGEDVNDVKRHGPPKLLAAGEAIPAIVVSPQCPTDSWWPREVPALLKLLDTIEAEYRVDPDRIYVTGLSMGGYGTFALAAAAPERIAAIAPVCGGGDFLDARRLSTMPTWAFHGDADEVVPVSESQRMIDFMNRSDGEQAKLTVYPGVGHDSWTRTYEDPALWAWLFAQRLSDRDATE